MIEAAGVAKTDTVIEIGPGFGVLTFALAEKARQVVAFEIEKKLGEYWQEEIEIKKLKNLEIIWGNALTQISNFKFQIINYKIVANLPYQITSNVLRALLELENKPESITIMVQKEVAERICAKPRSAGSRQAGDMSLLAVSVQYYGEPKIVDIVSRGNFWPSPKVDSAILHIKTLKHENNKAKPLPSLPYEGREKISDEEFFRVVKAGFANKRKQLHKNLSVGLKIENEKVKNVLKDVLNNEKIRAEELAVDDWKRIIEKLKNLGIK